MPSGRDTPSIFKKTDRNIQAEIRNRVETLKCRLKTRAFDKHKSQQEYSVNREKRMIEKSMEKMKSQTTGMCVAGVPPDGPMDNTHHQSPYFQGTSALSEKRLLKWRVKEKQVQKSKKAFEEELGRFPWEQEEPVLFGESFQIVMGFMGFDPEQIENMVQTKPETSKPRLHLKLNADTDVFECLRKESLEERRKKQLQMFKSKSLTSFCVKEWQSDRVKEYADSLTQPLKPQRVYRRIQSAPGETVGSKHAWAESKNEFKLANKPKSAGKLHTKVEPPPRLDEVNIGSDNFEQDTEIRDLKTEIDVPTGAQDEVDCTDPSDSTNEIQAASKINAAYDSQVPLRCPDEVDSIPVSSPMTKPATNPRNELPVSSQRRFTVHGFAKRKEQNSKTANPQLRRKSLAVIPNKSVRGSGTLNQPETDTDSNSLADRKNSPSVPQWKKDLLMEAPPGLAGAKGAEKVKLVMSKSQRRRELRQLVEDKTGDVQQIIGEEHRRRQQSRNNMMMTMLQVQQAVENLAPMPEDDEQEGEDSDMAEKIRKLSVRSPGSRVREGIVGGKKPGDE